MWSLIVIISATIAINAGGFEQEGHCKIAMEQAKPLEGKAACIWSPKVQVYSGTTLSGTSITLGR